MAMAETLYKFPPFFTIQPNDDTRKRQMDAWCQLILDHCRQNRIFQLNLTEALAQAPFRNDDIGRSLTEESLRTILDEMSKRGRIEWISDGDEKQSALIYWLKPEEWADVIKRWVNDKALNGTMCTFYEITQEEQSSAPELFELDERILLKALRRMENDGNAVLVKMDDSYGVKFL